MSIGKDNKDGSSHEVHDDDDTIDAPTSKYADGKKLSTTQPNQENPTPELSSVAPPEDRADRHQDAWSERSAVLSIERSFDRLSKIDLSVDRACHEVTDFHGGWSEYNREWSEEETNVLVAFAKKNIIQGCDNRKRYHEEDHDCAMNGRNIVGLSMLY
jgi:hypothetical protein